jgi:hypothetical protein
MRRFSVHRGRGPPGCSQGQSYQKYARPETEKTVNEIRENAGHPALSEETGDVH